MVIKEERDPALRRPTQPCLYVLLTQTCDTSPHNNKPSKQFGERSYLPDVGKLWKNFKDLFDKKAGLDPKFSFNQMATEIRELREGKGVAASTLKKFYKRKTNPRKSTLNAIKEWIDNNKEIDDSDNIINSSDNKEDNEI
ncbi:7213_t:CDS:2 [Dentiscutata erythropus]|uniref:7213_t:CDS:1 n=1 Tax=Dentiscutata erythropus TaxID=1348616 RepID=A0A9N9ELZ7_9GLOM|nr:7213_t:CDS:2 [Dentiscutata erythropus]